MRGDFEVDKGGYPIAAMPNHLVKGESYIMDVRTMNKLLDARNIPTKLASHIAAVLNAGLRAKRYESDWVKLNASSLEVYEAVIDPTETPTPIEPAEVGEGEGEGDTVQNTPLQQDGQPPVEAVVPDDSTAEESTPEVVLQNPASPEANAALAAIIAEANGESAEPATATPALEDVGAGAAVAERVAGTILTPAPLVIPAIQPLQAPAK